MKEGPEIQNAAGFGDGRGAMVQHCGKLPETKKNKEQFSPGAPRCQTPGLQCYKMIVLCCFFFFFKTLFIC